MPKGKEVVGEPHGEEHPRSEVPPLAKLSFWSASIPPLASGHTENEAQEADLNFFSLLLLSLEMAAVEQSAS